MNKIKCIIATLIVWREKKNCYGNKQVSFNFFSEMSGSLIHINIFVQFAYVKIHQAKIKCLTGKQVVQPTGPVPGETQKGTCNLQL